MRDYSVAARAAQIAHDGFTPSFPIYANGGTGFAGKADLDLGTVPIYSSGAFAIDAIRIATSYAEVLPSGDGPRNDSQGCLVEPR